MIGIDIFALEDKKRWYGAFVCAYAVQERNSFLAARVRMVGCRTLACMNDYRCAGKDTYPKASFVYVVNAS
jgi:hypothetical protein